MSDSCTHARTQEDLCVGLAKSVHLGVSVPVHRYTVHFGGRVTQNATSSAIPRSLSPNIVSKSSLRPKLSYGEVRSAKYIFITTQLYAAFSILTKSGFWQCTGQPYICATWDVTACDGVLLGEQRSGGQFDACGHIQVAPARAKLHRRLQRELQVTVYIPRQSQGVDITLRADMHPRELCGRGSKTALRASRFS